MDNFPTFFRFIPCAVSPTASQVHDHYGTKEGDYLYGRTKSLLGHVPVDIVRFKLRLSQKSTEFAMFLTQFDIRYIASVFL